MRVAFVVVVLFTACSSASATPSATPSNNDVRICAAALQPPWNGQLIGSLTTNPSTPIEEQAAEVAELFETNAGRSVTEWDRLSQMCVDAGY